MKKILLMSGLSKGGGAERVLSILANYFSNNHNDVTYSSYFNNGYYQLNNKVKKKVFNSSNKLILMRDIRQYISDNKFDVIICFMYPVSYILFLSTLGLKNKPIVISSERSDPSKPTKFKFEKYLRNWAYKKSDHVVFQTNQARDFFKNINIEKTSIIKNPISNELPKVNKGIRNRNIIAIGRLTEQKNFSLLIKVFKKISNEFEDYNLDIYGEGPLESDLKSLISSLDLTDKIKIHGFSNEIYNILNKSGIYVSCSNYEGISNSMLEALSIGIPTICTDCPVGGAKENIIDGVNGLLVEVNNEKQLYDAIKKIIIDKEFANYLSSNHHIVRNKLSVDNIGKQWTQLIDCICHDKECFK